MASISASSSDSASRSKPEIVCPTSISRTAFVSAAPGISSIITVEWKEKKKKKLILDGESRKPKEIALDLLNQGIDVKTVSNKLEVSVSSILGYICEYIKDKNELHFKFNPTIYYCDDEKELIQKSINKFGEDKLKDIKQSLPDYIKYESIRAVIIEKYIS